MTNSRPFKRGDLIITCTKRDDAYWSDSLNNKLGIIESAVDICRHGYFNETRFKVFIFEGPHNTSRDDGCWFLLSEDLALSNNEDGSKDE